MTDAMRAGGRASRPTFAVATVGWPAQRWQTRALDLLWAAVTAGPLDDAGVPIDGPRSAAAGPSDPGPGGAGSADTGLSADEQTRLAAIVELAQRGDAEAYGVLYERYVDQVFRYIQSRVASRQLAEDLTSETFLRGLRRIDSFSWQGRDMVAWFITIARNLILDNAKSARFRHEVSTGEMFDADQTVEAVDTEVIAKDRAARLMEALNHLKPEQAECLTLRFLHERSLAETAEILGKSEGAIKQLQLRAVRSLREHLGDLEW